MYRLLYRVVLRRVPAEAAHRAGFGLIRAAARVPGAAGLLRRWLGPRDPVLRVRALGLDFPGPLGLAAGFDKDARATAGLGALGFGFVEVGTVTAQAQPGNPRPRMFRLTRGPGAGQPDGVQQRRGGRRGRPAAPARRRPAAGRRGQHRQDQGGAGRRGGRGLRGQRAGGGALADYVVVNVSSPNTPGLRDLQAADRLRPLLVAVREALDARCRRAARAAAGEDRARSRRRGHRRGRRPRGRARARRHHRDQHHDRPRRAGQPGGRGGGRRGGRPVRAAAAGRGRSRCCAGCARAPGTAWC